MAEIIFDKDVLADGEDHGAKRLIYNDDDDDDSSAAMDALLASRMDPFMTASPERRSIADDEELSEPLLGEDVITNEYAKDNDTPNSPVHIAESNGVALGVDAEAVPNVVKKGDNDSTTAEDDCNSSSSNSSGALHPATAQPLIPLQKPPLMSRHQTIRRRPSASPERCFANERSATAVPSTAIQDSTIPLSEQHAIDSMRAAPHVPAMPPRLLKRGVSAPVLHQRAPSPILAATRRSSATTSLQDYFLPARFLYATTNMMAPTAASSSPPATPTGTTTTTLPFATPSTPTRSITSLSMLARSATNACIQPMDSLDLDDNDGVYIDQNAHRHGRRVDLNDSGIDDDDDSLNSEEELEQKARQIRSQLRQLEMMELAVEAEKAAAAGRAKFSAKPSTFAGDGGGATEMVVRPEQQDADPHTQPTPLRRHASYSEGGGGGGKFLLPTPPMPPAAASGAGGGRSLLRGRHAFGPAATLLRTTSGSYYPTAAGLGGGGGGGLLLNLRAVHEVLPMFAQFHKNLRTHYARHKIKPDVLLYHEGNMKVRQKLAAAYNAMDQEKATFMGTNVGASRAPSSSPISDCHDGGAAAAIQDELHPHDPQNFLRNFRIDRWVGAPALQPCKLRDDDDNDGVSSLPVGELLSDHLFLPDEDAHLLRRLRRSKIVVPPGLHIPDFELTGEGYLPQYGPRSRSNTAPYTFSPAAMGDGGGRILQRPSPAYISPRALFDQDEDIGGGEESDSESVGGNREQRKAEVAAVDGVGTTEQPSTPLVHRKTTDTSATTTTTQDFLTPVRLRDMRGGSTSALPLGYESPSVEQMIFTADSVLQQTPTTVEGDDDHDLGSTQGTPSFEALSEPPPPELSREFLLMPRHDDTPSPTSRVYRRSPRRSLIPRGHRGSLSFSPKKYPPTSPPQPMVNVTSEAGIAVNDDELEIKQLPSVKEVSSSDHSTQEGVGKVSNSDAAIQKPLADEGKAYKDDDILSAASTEVDEKYPTKSPPQPMVNVTSEAGIAVNDDQLEIKQLPSVKEVSSSDHSTQGGVGKVSNSDAAIRKPLANEGKAYKDDDILFAASADVDAHGSTSSKVSLADCSPRPSVLQTHPSPPAAPDDSSAAQARSRRRVKVSVYTNSPRGRDSSAGLPGKTLQESRVISVDGEAKSVTGNAGAEAVQQASQGPLDCDARIDCECLELAGATSMDTADSLRDSIGTPKPPKQAREMFASSPLSSVKEATSKATGPEMVEDAMKNWNLFLPGQHKRTGSNKFNGRKHFQAAMDMLSELSPRHAPRASDVRRKCVSKEDNDAFLHNYLYNSKPGGGNHANDGATMCAAGSAADPCRDAKLPCGDDGGMGADNCCMSLFNDTAVTWMPRRVSRHHVHLSRTTSPHKKDPETWFDVANERFDGMLEQIVGRGGGRKNNEWNIKFEAPSLQKHIDEHNLDGKFAAPARTGTSEDDLDKVQLEITITSEDEETDDDGQDEKKTDALIGGHRRHHHHRRVVSINNAPVPLYSKSADSLSDTEFQLVYGTSRSSADGAALTDAAKNDEMGGHDGGGGAVVKSLSNLSADAGVDERRAQLLGISSGVTATPTTTAMTMTRTLHSDMVPPEVLTSRSY